MDKKRSLITAIKITGTYVLITTIIFTTLYLLVDFQNIKALYLIIIVILTSSLVLLFIIKREIGKKNVQLKFFSEKKDSYQELFLNFNKVNLELNSTNKQLAESNKKLEELDKFKNVFLANMSHEIRTPLNSILGFSELICYNDLHDNKKSKYIQIVKNNSKQLLRIINDILEISKLETNQFKLSKSYFNINYLIDESLLILNEFIETSKKNIVVNHEKEFIDGDDFFYSDRQHILQVMEYLMDNAVKFTKAGEIKIGYQITKDKFLQFYVKDNGRGIHPNNHKLIFKRFRQEEQSRTRRYNGTGLGLPISKGIVELLGGEIWISPAIKKGTSIFFTVPYNRSTNTSQEQNDKKTFPKSIIASFI